MIVLAVIFVVFGAIAIWDGDRRGDSIPQMLGAAVLLIGLLLYVGSEAAG